ncbi:hypothetical protein [Lactobacillus johnsonii]|uniref:hypothetical protein n=1 Tax=Lactobacillus johnsonii TaxID=33959 RepID=UPI0014336CCB|nr:hypothetical protein [Lactobacillus johnsonii]GFI21132.1 hypothetical protein IMSAGC010_01693 [Lactobacillus johnsonii]
MTNNQKDFKQNIDAETTNLRPSSASEQSINDPAYKSVAKEMVQLAPNAPDTTIDLGDSISFDLNAFEDTFLSFNEDKKSRNAFAQPGKVFINGSKAHTENIDNATSAGINSNAQKEGKVLGYISARKSFKMNKINKTPKMNNKALSSADYKIENYTKLADEANWLNNEGKKNRDTVARPNITKEKEEFKHKLEQYPVIVNSKHDGEANLEKPIYSQWFIQRDKAEKAYEDLEKLGFPRDYQSKESKRLDNLSRKISPATIHKLENAYVSTRNIYFDDETSEVKNVSLLSNNTKEKIERNGKKYLSQEHAKQVLKHKRLER